VSTIDHQASHVWTKMANGRIRCGYVGCQARPTLADYERLEAEIVTAARMRIRLDLTSRTG
jgi:hypothetical protein